eukprot:m.142952 g.142952  ORF g.142952 m.142952 type:complete len:178 (-) comp52629_c0_seq1:105-638(-)
MNTALGRLSSLTSAWFSALALVAALLTLHTLIIGPTLPTNISFNVQDIKLKRYRTAAASQDQNDVALVNFNLTADFRPTFDWNTKEIFVFVVAEFATSKNKQNQLTIWDRIIWHSKRNEHLIQVTNEQAEYLIVDDGNQLRNKEVTLVLYFNHIPFSGWLPVVPHKLTSVTLSPTYS